MTSKRRVLKITIDAYQGLPQGVDVAAAGNALLGLPQGDSLYVYALPR